MQYTLGALPLTYLKRDSIIVMAGKFLTDYDMR